MATAKLGPRLKPRFKTLAEVARFMRGDSFAASRSSTTMRTLSIRLSVMFFLPTLDW